MNIQLLETLEKLKMLFPYLALSLAASVIMLLIFRLLADNVWISDRRFRLCGVFYALDPLSAAALCCAWIQMVTAILIVVLMKDISLLVIGYYLMPSVVFVFLTRPVRGILARFLWMLLQLTGLVAVVLIKGYISDTYALPVMIGVFYVMALIVVLFSVYLFFLHVSMVSESKRIIVRQKNKEMAI